jgi:hypothetical protein
MLQEKDHFSKVFSYRLNIELSSAADHAKQSRFLGMNARFKTVP